MTWLRRDTIWMDSRGNVVQVATAFLDEDTWEARCEAYLTVGPFDDAVETLHECGLQAAALRDRQLAGQRQLELEV